MNASAQPCPCCGNPVPASVARREDLVGLVQCDSPVFLAILRRLAWRPGQMVSSATLAEYVWQYDAGGGPLDAGRAIYNAIYRYESTLDEHGWTIENHYGRWRLVLLEQAAK